MYRSVIPPAQLAVLKGHKAHKDYVNSQHNNAPGQAKLVSDHGHAQAQGDDTEKQMIEQSDIAVV